MERLGHPEHERPRDMVTWHLVHGLAAFLRKAHGLLQQALRYEHRPHLGAALVADRRHEAKAVPSALDVGDAQVSLQGAGGELLRHGVDQNATID